MKKITLLILLTQFAFQAVCGINFEFSYGINSPQLKQEMERQTVMILDAINNAAANSSEIDYSGINISPAAAEALSMTWGQVHFRTEDDDIVEACLTLKNRKGVLRGYEIRNIGLELIPTGDEPLPWSRQELCIDFDPKGQIVDINFTMDNSQYVKALSESERLNDLDQRMQILGWCEKFRQAYIDKNLPFMEDVFSEDALIITGKVISGRREGNFPKVEVSVKGKAEYLAGLKRVFALPGRISVTFDDYRIQRHPNNPDIYYVTLIQGWKASNYSDDGIVVLVWDFTNEDHPEILVRTWQPVNTKPFDINDMPIR